MVFRKYDLVELINNDPNILGMIKKNYHDGTYQVAFQMHSNHDAQNFTKELRINGANIKPVEINFRRLHRYI